MTTPPRLLRSAPVLVLLSVLASAAPAAAQGFQWPDEPENLEVLPDTIGSDGLRRVMTGFTDALGVRCGHCHVGEGDLSDYDFAADDRETKRTARIMMRMVREINESHLDEVDPGDDGQRVQVRCVTCHRGAEKPRMIQEVLHRVVREAGADSAVARYRELRAQLYGGFTYDFRQGPLSELAQRLAMEGDTDAALLMARLETDYHPESYRAHFALGQVQREAGLREEAVASMEKALELAPDRARDFLRRQLQRLRGS